MDSALFLEYLTYKYQKLKVSEVMERAFWVRKLLQNQFYKIWRMDQNHKKLRQV